MDDLKLDHIIHYVQNLNDFNYPGHLFKLYQGGQHEKLGTYNRLAFLDNTYLELLDVHKPQLLKKVVKTEEGRVTFPSKIVQDNFRQGIKNIAFRTQDIDQVKESLESRNVDVIGPVKMQRENRRGKRLTWRVLYIADPDYRVKPPFFIQWDDADEVRAKKIDPYAQNEFKVHGIKINSTERKHTVAKWKNWFDMEVVEETDHYTTMKLKNNDILYHIYDGDFSGYKTILLKDKKTTSSYTLIIRGATYQFTADTEKV